MRMIFLSNYFNHHQQPFCDAINGLLEGDFLFIETQAMEQERIDLGWGQVDFPPYVVRNFVYENSKAEYQRLVDEADVVLIGSAPESLIKNRIRNKRLTFCYSERWLKEKLSFLRYILHLFRRQRSYPARAPIYMLCASGYTASDCAKFGVFRNKCYKWGYFPPFHTYGDIESLLNAKTPDSLLWVGRFIDCKHPETPLLLAKRLKDSGYSFEMNLIGTGALEKKMRHMIDDLGLGEHAHMLGAMSPDEVRKHMERSSIFLFTSDRNEGWGAVLNEAMNSACSVIANEAIGSVPFLIDGNNGLTYADGDLEDLYEKTTFILNNPSSASNMAKHAYLTIAEEWNAKTAAERLLLLIADLQCANKSTRFTSGPCSKA